MIAKTSVYASTYLLAVRTIFRSTVSVFVRDEGLRYLRRPFGITTPSRTVSTRHRPFEQRWTPLAGQGTLGASYLPGCPARLAEGVGWPEARARLALLWSERASALQYRRALLATVAMTIEGRLSLARLDREIAAYEGGAAKLRGISPPHAPWLVRRLASRHDDPIVGAAFATMSSELAVLGMALRLATQ